MTEPSHLVVGPLLDAERDVLRGPDVKCGFTYGADRPRSGKLQTRMKRCFTYRDSDCICSFNHAPHEFDYERQWKGAATGCRSRDMPDLRHRGHTPCEFLPLARLRFEPRRARLNRTRRGVWVGGKHERSGVAGSAEDQADRSRTDDGCGAHVA